MDMYEVVKRAVRECCEELYELYAEEYAKRLKTDTGREEVRKRIIEYMLKRDIPDLEFEEDWNFLYERRRMWHEIARILDRIAESMKYECDLIFGIEEPFKPRAEELAKFQPQVADLIEEIFAVFEDIQRKVYSNLKPEDVAHDWEECNKIVSNIIKELSECIRLRVIALQRQT